MSAAAPAATDPVEPLDVDLVKRSQAGDTRAFDLLVTRYRGRIYAMTYHLVQNETEAWDLAQEAFIKAWRALPNFKQDAAFYTWLYRIAHNVTYDWLRKKKIQGDGEFDDERTEHRAMPGSRTAPQGFDAPDRAIKRQELGQRKHMLAAALKQLTDRERHIIVERRLIDEPKTLEDLSSKYGISRERVRQIEAEALRKLRRTDIRARLAEYLEG